jgi:hypothetical protein
VPGRRRALSDALCSSWLGRAIRLVTWNDGHSTSSATRQHLRLTVPEDPQAHGISEVPYWGGVLEALHRFAGHLRRVLPVRLDVPGAAPVPANWATQPATVVAVAHATKIRGLGAEEKLVAVARVRRIIGPVTVTPTTKSFVSSTVDRVRTLRLSRTIGLTGRRVLVLRRGLWTGRPKTILAEVPLSKVRAAALPESRPISDSIWTARRTKSVATISLRNGDVLTVHVYSTIDQGQRKYRWTELRQFEYMLNRHIGF